MPQQSQSRGCTKLKYFYQYKWNTCSILLIQRWYKCTRLRKAIQVSTLTWLRRILLATRYTQDIIRNDNIATLSKCPAGITWLTSPCSCSSGTNMLKHMILATNLGHFPINCLNTRLIPVPLHICILLSNMPQEITRHTPIEVRLHTRILIPVVTFYPSKVVKVLQTATQVHEARCESKLLIYDICLWKA
jgi:hypothetical protein